MNDFEKLVKYTHDTLFELVGASEEDPTKLTNEIQDLKNLVSSTIGEFIELKKILTSEDFELKNLDKLKLEKLDINVEKLIKDSLQLPDLTKIENSLAKIENSLAILEKKNTYELEKRVVNLSKAVNTIFKTIKQNEETKRKEKRLWLVGSIILISISVLVKFFNALTHYENILMFLTIAITIYLSLIDNEGEE